MSIKIGVAVKALNHSANQLANALLFFGGQFVEQAPNHEHDSRNVGFNLLDSALNRDFHPLTITRCAIRAIPEV